LAVRLSSFLSSGKSDATSLGSFASGEQQLARRKHLSVAAHAYPSGKNLRSGILKFSATDSPISDTIACNTREIKYIHFIDLYLCMLHTHYTRINNFPIKIYISLRVSDMQFFSPRALHDKAKDNYEASWKSARA